MNEAPESAVQRRQHFDERFAANLRGFGLVGIIAIVIIFSGNLVVAPLSALFVLLWVWLSRTPWREIGYVRPKSWIGGLAIGVVFGAMFKLVMKGNTCWLLHLNSDKRELLVNVQCKANSAAPEIGRAHV